MLIYGDFTTSRSDSQMDDRGRVRRGVRLQGTVAGFDKWLDFMEFQHIKCASMTPSETVYYWNFVDEVVGKAQMMDKRAHDTHDPQWILLLLRRGVAAVQ